MSKEKLEELSRELGINKMRNIGNLAKGNLATMIMQSAIQAGGFASYKIALIVANAVAKQMLGRGLTLAAAIYEENPQEIQQKLREILN